MAKKATNWIAAATSKNKGALREKLGAKPGKPIPAGKLEKAAEKGGKIGKEARLAEILRKINK